MKLIKFGAEWCGPCRILDAKLDKFTDCEVIRYSVDDDEVSELLDKYKIRNIPVTILLDDNGETVNKWVGDFDVNEVKKYL